MKPDPRIPNSHSRQPPADRRIQETSGGGSFKGFLLDSIREVNSMQQDADQAVEKLVSGEGRQPGRGSHRRAEG